MNQSRSEVQIATSVLVIGTGGSGLRAAIELAERRVDVLAVGKRPTADAHTSLAAGGINAALATMDPEDTWQQHAADTLKESYLLADPRTVQIVTEGAARGIADLERYGMPFAREAGRADLAALLRRAHLPPHRVRRRLHRARDPAHAGQPRRAAAHPDPRHASTSPGCSCRDGVGLRRVRLRPGRRHALRDPRRRGRSSPPAATPGSGGTARRAATRTPATRSASRSRPAAGSATPSWCSSTRPD